MKLQTTLATLVCFTCVLAMAQKGSAPSGFYPSNYNGDTFTGRLIQVDEHGSLLLEYSHGGKHQEFAGTIQSPCMGATKSGHVKEFPIRAIPKGTVLTAFYNPATVEEAGLKTATNWIMAIRLVEVNGTKQTDAQVIPCSTGASAMKAFDGPPAK